MYGQLCALQLLNGANVVFAEASFPPFNLREAAGFISLTLWVTIRRLEAGGHKEMSSILADQKRPRNMSPNAGEEGVAGSQPMRRCTSRDMEPK
jgi:hypothetical protein